MTQQLSNSQGSRQEQPLTNPSDSMSPLCTSTIFKSKDLVRLSDNQLAIVTKVPDDSSDEESDSSESDEEGGHYTDDHGRLLIGPDPYSYSNFPQMPLISINSQQQQSDSSNAHNFSVFSNPFNALISTYDDDDDGQEGDNESDDESDDEDDDEGEQNRNIHSLQNESHHASNHQLNNITSLPFIRQQTSFNSSEIPDGSSLICIALTGEEKILANSDLTLIDRSFDNAQIICPVQFSQSHGTGVIESVQKTLIVRHVSDITPETVTSPDPNTCFEVSTDQLGFFVGIGLGDTVVRKNCVGFVAFFQEEVLVQFSDGSLAAVPGDPNILHNIDARTPNRYKLEVFNDSLFYPGQKVLALPDTWRRIAMWFQGSYHGENTAVVKGVRVGNLGVQWTARSMLTPDNESFPFDGPEIYEHEPEIVSMADITLLESFVHERWNVGDRGYMVKEAKIEEEKSTKKDGTELHSSRRSCESGSSKGCPSGSECTTSRHHEVSQGPVNIALRRALGQSCQQHSRRTATNDEFLKSFINTESVVQVIETRTRVNVLWQDGTRSTEVPATSLIWANRTHEYLPGDLVRRSDENENETTGVDDQKKGPVRPCVSNKTGIVIRMDPSEKTAIVRWQDNNTMQFDNEEEVSAYDVDTKYLHDVRIGDTVLYTPSKMAAKANNRTEWVGIVLRKNLGSCTVAWHGSTVSDVSLTEILLVDNPFDSYDSDSDESDDSDDSEEDLSSTDGSGSPSSNRLTTIRRRYKHNWGDEDDEDVLLDSSPNSAAAKTLTNLFNQFKESNTNCAKFSSVVLRQAVAQSVDATLKLQRKNANDFEISEGRIKNTTKDAQTLAWIYFGRAISMFLEESFMRSREAESPSQGKLTDRQWEMFKEILQDGLDQVMSLFISTETNITAKTDVEMEITESSEPSMSNEIPQPSTIGNEFSSPHQAEEIQSFEILSELESFHTFSGSSAERLPSPGHARIVQKEWRRLQGSLPSGIIVRGNEAIEQRIRAAIIGPQGTPYEYVIFFFDILLGGSYPISPPNVWFHSYGRRLNPNLYEDGKVCLSILGTWDGDDVETWDPKTSNLLRVLLSLQGLVFVNQPYFNEAGYSKQKGTKEGELNSWSYNESTFLMCMKHIISTLKAAGPKDCIDIAREHYKQVAPHILRRCKAVIQEDIHPEEKHSTQEVRETQSHSTPKQDDLVKFASAGFKRSVAQLTPLLERSLLSLM